MARKKHERKSRIATLTEKKEAADGAKNRRTFDVPFRRERVALPRFKVEIDLPMYRIQSGRTRRAQCQYLDEHSELPKNFFDDPEDPSVQAAQHQILLRMIHEGDLAADLKERKQLEPLVLTIDGYVVDGNRRLAALRERKEDYAEAVVLPPDALNHEIYETEIELQMQRDTKAPYNWIDQALHIEYGIKELKEDVAKVAQRMRMTEDIVLRELAKLALVQGYLLWNKTEGMYHKVPEAGGGSMAQAFEELSRGLESSTIKRKAESEKRLIREACFSAIKAEQGYQKVREVIKHLGKNVDKVSQKLRERKLPTKKKPPTKPIGKRAQATLFDAADPLSLIATTDYPEPNEAVEELIAVAADEKTAPILMDIVEDLEAEEKEAKKQQVPLQRIGHALSDLKQVELSKMTDELDEIAKTLAQIIDEAERLSKAVEKLQAKK